MCFGVFIRFFVYKRFDVYVLSVEVDGKVFTMSISEQCRLLGVARSSYYWWRNHKDIIVANEAELALVQAVLDWWTEHPATGYQKLSRQLRENGHELATEKRVRKIMKRLGIRGVTPRPNTSRTGRGKQHKKYPYLLRGKKIEHANQVWATDITYLKLPTGMVYVVAIIDLFSRKILSYRVSNTMDVAFCKECLYEAINTYGVPAIWNSDQGSQFTSLEFLAILEGLQVEISMDGVGRCLDNVFMERTWRSLKYEHIFLYDYRSPGELRRGLKRFIDFFNSERLHQGLDYQTPDAVYYGAFPIRELEKRAA